MKKLLLGSFLFCSIFSYCATVRLINDSPFTLASTILSATGDVMGRYTLEPQVQVSWEN